MQFIDRHETPELIIFSVVGRYDYAEHTVEELTPARVFHVRTAGRSEWATAIVRAWQGGGSIDIQSDYGHYSYLWGCIGDDDIYAFLRSLDFEYFMKKACPAFKVFDADASIKAIREYILDMRRTMSISQEVARSLWDDLEDLDSCDSQDLFYERVGSLSYIGDIYPDWDIPLYDRPTYTSKLFWNGPWHALCQHWRNDEKQA